jgi:hypothetical protein
MDLRKIISYNNYEGFRWVLGYYKWQVLKISELKGIPLMVHKRRNFKYNIGLSTRVGKFSDSWIIYTNDVNEITILYMTSKKNLLNFTIRDL